VGAIHTNGLEKKPFWAAKTYVGDTRRLLEKKMTSEAFVEEEARPSNQQTDGKKTLTGRTNRKSEKGPLHGLGQTKVLKSKGPRGGEGKKKKQSHKNWSGRRVDGEKAPNRVEPKLGKKSAGYPYQSKSKMRERRQGHP